MAYQAANKGYDGMSRRGFLNTLIAVPVAATAGLVGCTSKPKTLGELSDEEIMSAYMSFARKVSPKVSEALFEWGQRNGYAGINNLPREVYFSIVENETLKLAKDPDVQRMLNLQREFTLRHLGRLGGSEKDLPNMDVTLLRRSPDTLYPAIDNLPAFYDPELLFPARNVNLAPDNISNSLTYQTQGGIESILVPSVLPDRPSSTRADKLNDIAQEKGDFNTDWHTYSDFWTSIDFLSKIQTKR